MYFHDIVSKRHQQANVFPSKYQLKWYSVCVWVFSHQHHIFRCSLWVFSRPFHLVCCPACVSFCGTIICCYCMCTFVFVIISIATASAKMRVRVSVAPSVNLFYHRNLNNNHPFIFIHSVMKQVQVTQLST